MIRFHKPLLEELRFRQQLLSDSQTMAYNARWGGAVGFPQERWADWYRRWVEHPDRRFYAYLYSEEEKAAAKLRQLEAENRRLQMENDFLKKLNELEGRR